MPKTIVLVKPTQSPTKNCNESSEKSTNESPIQFSQNVKHVFTPQAQSKNIHSSEVTGHTKKYTPLASNNRAAYSTMVEWIQAKKSIATHTSMKRWKKTPLSKVFFIKGPIGSGKSFSIEKALQACGYGQRVLTLLDPTQETLIKTLYDCVNTKRKEPYGVVIDNIDSTISIQENSYDCFHEENNNEKYFDLEKLLHFLDQYKEANIPVFITCSDCASSKVRSIRDKCHVENWYILNEQELNVYTQTLLVDKRVFCEETGTFTGVKNNYKVFHFEDLAHDFQGDIQKYTNAIAMRIRKPYVDNSTSNDYKLSRSKEKENEFFDNIFSGSSALIAHCQEKTLESLCILYESNPKVYKEFMAEYYIQELSLEDQKNSFSIEEIADCADLYSMVDVFEGWKDSNSFANTVMALSIRSFKDRYWSSVKKRNSLGNKLNFPKSMYVPKVARRHRMQYKENVSTWSSRKIIQNYSIEETQQILTLLRRHVETFLPKDIPLSREIDSSVWDEFSQRNPKNHSNKNNVH